MKKGTAALSGVVLAMIIACGLAGGYLYAEHQKEVFKTYFGFLPSSTYWMNEHASTASFDADQKMVSKWLDKEWDEFQKVKQEMKKAAGGDPGKYEVARSSYFLASEYFKEAQAVAENFGYKSN